MIDSATRKPIRVSTDASSGPYVVVPVAQLDQVRNLLRDKDVPHWVDHTAISIDGMPAQVVINVGKKADPRLVQAILDEV